MKLLLQIIGWLSIALGLLVFLGVILGTEMLPPIFTPAEYRFAAVTWLIAGIIGGAVPLGLAEMLEKLERLLAKR